MPTALDELLQSVTTAHDGDRQHAVLAQLAEQLRNAAEILDWASTNARELPAPAWEWLRNATHTTRDLADGLDEVAPAFTTPRTPAAPPAPTAPSAPTHRRCR